MYKEHLHTHECVPFCLYLCCQNTADKVKQLTQIKLVLKFEGLSDKAEKNFLWPVFVAALSGKSRLFVCTK